MSLAVATATTPPRYAASTCRAHPRSVPSPAGRPGSDQAAPSEPPPGDAGRRGTGPAAASLRPPAPTHSLAIRPLPYLEAGATRRGQLTTPPGGTRTNSEHKPDQQRTTGPAKIDRPFHMNIQASGLGVAARDRSRVTPRCGDGVAVVAGRGFGDDRRLRPMRRRRGRPRIRAMRRSGSRPRGPRSRPGRLLGRRSGSPCWRRWSLTCGSSSRRERAGSRNSGNSSMPPSSDDLPGRKPPRKQRRAAERLEKKKRGSSRAARARPLRAGPGRDRGRLSRGRVLARR